MLEPQQPQQPQELQQLQGPPMHISSHVGPTVPKSQGPKVPRSQGPSNLQRGPLPPLVTAVFVRETASGYGMSVSDALAGLKPIANLKADTCATQTGCKRTAGSADSTGTWGEGRDVFMYLRVRRGTSARRSGAVQRT